MENLSSFSTFNAVFSKRNAFKLVQSVQLIGNFRNVLQLESANSFKEALVEIVFGMCSKKVSYNSRISNFLQFSIPSTLVNGDFIRKLFKLTHLEKKVYAGPEVADMN